MSLIFNVHSPHSLVIPHLGLILRLSGCSSEAISRQESALWSYLSAEWWSFPRQMWWPSSFPEGESCLYSPMQTPPAQRYSDPLSWNSRPALPCLCPEYKNRPLYSYSKNKGRPHNVYIDVWRKDSPAVISPCPWLILINCANLHNNLRFLRPSNKKGTVFLEEIQYLYSQYKNIAKSF